MSGEGKCVAGEGETLMDEKDFEGTIVLEMLARMGKVEEFFEAID